MENKNSMSIYAQNNLAERVITAQKTMQEFKQRQFIGTDSIRFFQQDSGLAYDWTGTLPLSPQSAFTGTKILRIRATALTQNVLFADIITELYVDTLSNGRHTSIDYSNELNNNVDSFNISSYQDATPPSQTNVVSWTVVVNANDPQGVAKPTNTCFVKVYVVSNDEVSIQVLEIN